MTVVAHRCVQMNTYSNAGIHWIMLEPVVIPFSFKTKKRFNHKIGLNSAVHSLCQRFVYFVVQTPKPDSTKVTKKTFRVNFRSRKR